MNRSVVVAIAVLLPLAVLVGVAVRAGEDPAPGDAPAAVPATRIEPGDILEVSVFGHPELSRPVAVQPDGSISYPFVGRLLVTGRSVEAIAKAIAEALEKGYSMRDPKVSVFVSSYSERRVFVLGLVAASGAHPLPVGRPLSLVQLISLSGGFREEADRSNVKLHRREKGRMITRTYDLSEIEITGAIASDVELSDGDTVVVPRAGEVAVLGQVSRPGTFVMRSGARNTVLRMIALAGGFTRLADRGDVLWTHVRGGKRAVRKLDVDEIIEGEAQDPAVGAGDILYVTERIF